MKVWEYKNYDEYVDAQVMGNLAKYKSHSYVDAKIIGGIVNYMISNKLKPTFGLCHGSRRGLEQEYFVNWFKSQNIDVSVLGTEISPTATEFKDTIQWDFNEAKDEWINGVDFIYSNSFDHSFNPSKTIDVWMSCLRDDGMCFVEWSDDCLKNRPMDPVAGTLEEWESLFNKKYKVADVLAVHTKGRVDGASQRYIIVIKK